MINNGQIVTGFKNNQNGVNVNFNRPASAYKNVEMNRAQEGVFRVKANMPSFIQTSQLSKANLSGKRLVKEDKRTSFAGVNRVAVGRVANVTVGGDNAGSMTERMKTPRIGNVEMTIEPSEEIRISNTKRIRDSNNFTPINIDSLPSAVQKRAAPIMQIYEQFETKCITSGLLNRAQASVINHYFQQLLTQCLPIINSELRYQHSEPVSAVLLMFAWERSKLPIKKFLKTINSCTKKELGRVGIIRRCKAFTVVKKLNHTIDRIEAL